jgi:ribosomal protein S18 acetylase RimI-like enzyme
MQRDLGGAIEAPAWPDGVRLRAFDKGDARAVHSVLESGYWDGGGGAEKFSRWWPKLRKDVAFDPALILLAVDGEGVVGVAHCLTSASVKDIAVHPRERRRGLGRALMLTAFGAFAARGAAHVDLKVREENIAAQSLYRALDMRVVAREPA